MKLDKRNYQASSLSLWLLGCCRIITGMVYLFSLAFCMLAIICAFISVKANAETAIQYVNRLIIADTPIALVKSVHQLIQLHQHKVFLKCVAWINQQRFAASLKINLNNSLLILLLIIELTHIRWLIIQRLFILLLLIVLLGVIDGLVARQIRKYQAARESSFLFHRLKQLSGVLLQGLFFGYWAMPFAVSLINYLLVMTALLSITIRYSLTYFKKYL